ncbi:hypothetical protein H0H93_013924, partial [Arthromyces matolae]
VLVGTLALALFNGSKDEIATKFAYGYAFISVGTVVYGFALYQYRISMIQRRDPGHFGLYPSRFTIFHFFDIGLDSIAGPIILGVVLFTAVLLNFIVRVRE